MLREIKKHLRQYPSIRHNYRAVHRAVSKSAAMETYYRGALLSVDHPDIDEVPQKLDRPRSAYIEITNACNINCKMCSTKLSTRPPTIMSPELYEHTVVELKKIGIHGAPLHTVGETFVHRNLSQLLDISAKHNFQVYISTNAQFPDKIVELYREHPNLANSFRFSIDGATEKTYEYIRVGGTFDKVLESLEAVHEINEGIPDYRIDLSIGATLSNTNINELADFFNLYTKYVRPENLNFGLINGLSPDASYFRDTFPFPHLIRPTYPCGMVFEVIAVTYDGDISMCCRDYDGDINIGNLNNGEILSFWNGEIAEDLRDQHRNPETMTNRVCKGCYSPYGFVGRIINHFIHYSWLKNRQITNDQFANNVTSLLVDMNAAMETQNLPAVREAVVQAFEAA